MTEIKWECMSFQGFLLSRGGKGKAFCASRAKLKLSRREARSRNGAQVLDIHVCICLAICSTKTMSGRCSGSGLMHVLTRPRSWGNGGSLVSLVLLSTDPTNNVSVNLSILAHCPSLSGLVQSFHSSKRFCNRLRLRRTAGIYA